MCEGCITDIITPSPRKVKARVEACQQLIAKYVYLGKAACRRVGVCAGKWCAGGGRG